jgi:hypothetical protein
VPTLTIVAGPNGSGKSTLTRSAAFDGSDRLLDPDAIARLMNPSHPSAAAIPAGREVLKRTAEYLAQGVSFAIETTLSATLCLGRTLAKIPLRRSPWGAATFAIAAVTLAAAVSPASYLPSRAGDARRPGRHAAPRLRGTTRRIKAL